MKHNARFQSEQVAKYLTTTQASANSRLLQFRAEARQSSQSVDWKQIEEALKTPYLMQEETHSFSGDEGDFFPEIRFASSMINDNTQAEVEFHLVKQQMRELFLQFAPRLQTVLGVLPEKHRLWLGEVHGTHPLRMREEFEVALKRIAETTAVPVVQMKILENAQEGEPSFFWSSTLGMRDQSKPMNTQATNSETGEVVDLIYVGHHATNPMNDLTYTATLKAAFRKCKEGEAVEFGVFAGGMTLGEAMKHAHANLQYGFDLVVDGISDWFKKSVTSPLPISALIGVKESKKAFVFEELNARNIPYIQFGTTTLTGEVRIFEQGEMRLRLLVAELFRMEKASLKDLLDEPIFMEESPLQPGRLKNRFSVEELLLKPETYHVSISSPVVVRPKFDSWAGMMILSDLCGQEFDGDYLEYLFRKCTAISGQIHSIQVSMVNGLKKWVNVLRSAESQFGIQLSQIEIIPDPNIKAHWLALQVVSKVADLRTIRSEDFKIVHDRIYWLPGSFEQPATRWLAGMEGRYQGSIHSAVAIESTRGRAGVIDTLTYALLKHRLGAEVRIQHHFPGGFFITVNENERFAVEEEWRAMEIAFEFVGRTTSSPFLVVRDEKDETQTISIEDLA